MCLSQTRKGHIYMLIKCIAAKRINKLPSKLGHSRRKTEHINHIFGKLHLQVFHLKKCGRHGADQTSAYGIKTPRVRYITALEVLLYFTPIGLRNTAFSCTKLNTSAVCILSLVGVCRCHGDRIHNSTISKTFKMTHIFSFGFPHF